MMALLSNGKLRLWAYSQVNNFPNLYPMDLGLATELHKDCSLMAYLNGFATLGSLSLTISTWKTWDIQISFYPQVKERKKINKKKTECWDTFSA